MSSSIPVKPSSLKIGDYIKFRVISKKDLAVYTGEVVGICDYTHARVYNTDLAAQHQLMANGISLYLASTTLAPVTEQKFLIIRCMDQVVRPFAWEWVMTANSLYGYVDKVEQGTIFNIRIYDATTAEASEAVQLLRNAGYCVKLTSV